MGALERDSELQRQASRRGAVWFYWLAWTVVVVIDAASYQRGVYHSWLLSPYAWWIAPFVLWWTIPRNTREHVSPAWPLFILAWSAWRVLNLEFETMIPWTIFAGDSALRLLQLPLKVAFAGAALALAFSRPVAWISGGLATRAAFVVGLCAAAMHFRFALSDLDRWQFQPIVNAVRVLDALLIALLLSVSTHWVRFTLRDEVARSKGSAVEPVTVPRIAGFGSLFSITALSMFGAAVARGTVDNPWTRFGIGVVGVVLPVALLTWAGVRAWRRLEPAMRGSPIFERLPAMAGRIGVFAGVGSLWMILIWHSAPRAGSDVVDAIRSLPGPLWSVTASPDRATIELHGELTPGVATAVRSALRSQPSVQFIELDSPGGLIQEALLIAMTVQSHGLITVAREECASACTGILASGRERWLAESADVGLHSPSALGLPIANAPEGNSQALESLGMSEALAERGGAVPSWDMWYPSEKELLDSGLITRVVTAEEYGRAVSERVTQLPRGSSGQDPQ